MGARICNPFLKTISGKSCFGDFLVLKSFARSCTCSFYAMIDFFLAATVATYRLGCFGFCFTTFVYILGANRLFCIGSRVWAIINTSSIPHKNWYILDCAGGPFFYTLVHALWVVKVSWTSRNATVSFRNLIWFAFIFSLSFAEVEKTYGQNDETKLHGCFCSLLGYTKCVTDGFSLRASG